MGIKLTTQLILLVTGGLIILTFIRPVFADISVIQDELLQYEDAVAKAEQVNQRLRELVSIENSFSRNNLEALERFLPSEIDAVAVMKDITTIIEVNEAKISTISTAENTEPVRNISFEASDLPVQSGVESQDFEITFDATYEELRGVLRDLEANAYTLEIMTMTFTSEPSANEIGVIDDGSEEFDDGSYSYRMILRAYKLANSAQ